MWRVGFQAYLLAFNNPNHLLSVRLVPVIHCLCAPLITSWAATKRTQECYLVHSTVVIVAIDMHSDDHTCNCLQLGLIAIMMNVNGQWWCLVITVIQCPKTCSSNTEQKLQMGGSSVVARGSHLQITGTWFYCQCLPPTCVGIQKSNTLCYLNTSS